ncbi:Spy/CpxP family protein refolding chaperone [Sphingomonas sp. PB2P19]|uniref:Spy/CpxP family protein refolding chaperone n=1 Tax=Sphingomonas rhamnosi TaxID=3096156 RepID=UPI002FC8E540
MIRYAYVLMLASAAPATAEQQPDGPRPRPDVTAMHQREGDDLALVLGLSAAQRPALAAFLALDAPHEPRMMRPDTAPGFEQQLAEQERRLAKRNADDGKRIAAMRTFYAALDARQRRVFEAVLRLRNGPGGPGGPGPHGLPNGLRPDRG